MGQGRSEDLAAVLTMARRTISQIIWLVSAAATLVACGARPTNTVTVYVSEDQVFSEPILKDFERQTGIRVNAIFDTEEAKSTGVMNRLLAEKNNPQADVYWANEPVRADVLKQRGISAAYKPTAAGEIPDQFKDPDAHWTGFSARARLLVVNKSARIRPSSILAYLDPKTKGKGVIANPLFGTTTAQMAALFSLWGDEKGKRFLDGLKTNQVKLAGSNGESADFVASGEFEFALVDSDDAVARIRHGKPLEIVYPDQGEGEAGVLILPNAVALIRGGPNPDRGKDLIEYLVSKETERKLAFADCAQIPLHPGVATPKEIKPIEQIRTMKVSYAELGVKLQAIQPILKQWTGY